MNVRWRFLALLLASSSTSPALAQSNCLSSLWIPLVP